MASRARAPHSKHTYCRSKGSGIPWLEVTAVAQEDRFDVPKIPDHPVGIDDECRRVGDGGAVFVQQAEEILTMLSGSRRISNVMFSSSRNERSFSGSSELDEALGAALVEVVADVELI